MRKPTPKADPDLANRRTEVRRPAAVVPRRVILCLSTLVSGAALVTVIYFLRLDTFVGRAKSLVDLVMVAVAVGFLVSLYMVVDSTLKKSEDGSGGRSRGNR